MQQPRLAASWIGDAELAAELERNRFNPNVGQRLVGQNERVRVWSIRLRPGERLPYHRHVLDYFWTALTPGRALSHQEDGRTLDVTYEPGDTSFESFGKDQYKLHDLVNVGDAELAFTTVEFLDGANAPPVLPGAGGRPSP